MITTDRPRERKTFRGALLPLRRPAVAALLLGVAVSVSSGVLAAQSCNGTPTLSGMAYELGSYATGTSHGVALTKVGRRVALGADAKYRGVTSSLTGVEGNVRLSGIFGSSRFSVCPGLGLGVIHDTWDVRSALSLRTTTVGANAGFGFGYEQPLTKDVYLIQFERVGFGYSAILYSITASNANTDVTADTLSGVSADYGVLLHYRHVYTGFAASRAPGSQGGRPSVSRILFGVSFSDRGRRE